MCHVNRMKHPSKDGAMIRNYTRGQEQKKKIETNNTRRTLAKFRLGVVMADPSCHTPGSCALIPTIFFSFHFCTLRLSTWKINWINPDKQVVGTLRSGERNKSMWKRKTNSLGIKFQLSSMGSYVRTSATLLFQ